MHSRDCALDGAGILLSWPRRLEIKLTTCGLSRCPCHTFFIVLGDGDDDAAEDDIEALNDAGAMKTSTLAKLKLSIMTCPAKR